MQRDMIVLDDGDFYIELNGNYDAVSAPGFLQRRCARGLTTPGGYECVGSFQRATNGRWRADVNAPFDEETEGDCLVLGEFGERMHAIAALWQRRHAALCIHR